MPNSIAYTNITTPMPYASVNDVLNLIGTVSPIQQGTFLNNQIQAAIAPAQRYLEQACNRKFYPHRKVYQFDGNGTSRAVIKERPFININSLSVYFLYPMNLLRVAYDYQLLTDHGSGVISFPEFFGSSMFAPYGFSFPRGNRNITLDIQAGYSEDSYGQPMTTTDNLTYTFPVGAVVNKSLNITPDYQNPPQISPTIYVNGVPLVNTTYVYEAVGPANQGQWLIATDSIYYTLNSQGSGITSVTFLESQSTNTITADFTAAFIPPDINEACAKLAAIRCLESMSTGWFGNLFDGTAKVASENTQFDLHLSGRFGHQIDNWTQDVNNIISVNQRIALGSIGTSFNAARGL